MPNEFPLAVADEEDAWTLLEQWLKGGNADSVLFVGWPTLHIDLAGDDYDGSLNSGQMASLVDLKMAFGRAYAVIAHGAYDMRRLRAEEEEKLIFTTKVKKGSSILDTDLSPLVQAISSAVTAYPGFSVAAAALIGLTFVSRPLVVRYYDDRAKQLDATERKRLLDLSLSRKDEQRLETFSAAVAKLETRYPQFAQVMPDARESFWRLASASVDADRMNVAGLELSQDDLEILAEKRTRRRGDLRHIEEVFSVVSIRKADAVFKIGLESKALALNAIYRRPQMTDSRMRKLMGFMASGVHIKAKLEVRTVDQAQLSGRLISFRAVDK